MSIKTDWIVAVANSDADGVKISRFFGSEKEVKTLLVNMVKEDRECDEDSYVNGTEFPDDVETDGMGRFDAYASYSNYHIDYSAEAFFRIRFLDENGNVIDEEDPD